MMHSLTVMEKNAKENWSKAKKHICRLQIKFKIHAASRYEIIRSVFTSITFEQLVGIIFKLVKLFTNGTSSTKHLQAAGRFHYHIIMIHYYDT